MKVREELREPSNELRGFSELLPASMYVHCAYTAVCCEKKKKETKNKADVDRNRMGSGSDAI
jgi:hypothetical protein